MQMPNLFIRRVWREILQRHSAPKSWFGQLAGLISQPPLLARLFAVVPMAPFRVTHKVCRGESFLH